MWRDIKQITVVAFLFLFAVSIQVALAAWTGPSATPPYNNTDVPITNNASGLDTSLQSILKGSLKIAKELGADTGIFAILASTSEMRVRKLCDEAGRNCYVPGSAVVGDRGPIGLQGSPGNDVPPGTIAAFVGGCLSGWTTFGTGLIGSSAVTYCKK